MLFELTFIPASHWLSLDNVSGTDLGEDGGRCLLVNNAASTKFWTPTLTDIWYKCDIPATAPVGGWGTSSAPNKCALAANTWATDAVQTELASTNNWSAPEIDEDY